MLGVLLLELTETLLSEHQDEPTIPTSHDHNDEHIAPSQDRKDDALTAGQEERTVSAVSCVVTDSFLSGGCDSGNTGNTGAQANDDVSDDLDKQTSDGLCNETDNANLQENHQENTAHNSRPRNRSSPHSRASRNSSTPGSRGSRLSKRVPLKRPEQTSTPRQGIRKFITETKRKGMETSPENSTESKSQRQDNDTGT